MDRWIKQALEYLPHWLEFQFRNNQLPGMSVAISYKSKIVGEWAYGVRDRVSNAKLKRGDLLRMGSQSKSLLSAGILFMQERGQLRISDPVGKYISGLHPKIAVITIEQILRHRGGIFRDGVDSRFWSGEIPFVTQKEILKQFKIPPVIPPNTRFKYSNFGYALLGLIVEKISGTSYQDWLQSTIVRPLGLKSTFSDAIFAKSKVICLGHPIRYYSQNRLVIPEVDSIDGYAPVGGVVSTPAEMLKFFEALNPKRSSPILSKRSLSALHRSPDLMVGEPGPMHYSLGLFQSLQGPWSSYGHSGAFSGTYSKTLIYPNQDIGISVAVNSLDVPARVFIHGIVSILKFYKKNQSTQNRCHQWQGRWYGLMSVLDFLPVGDKVYIVAPASTDIFVGMSEMKVGRDPCRGRVTQSTAIGSYGEKVELVLNKRGHPTHIQFGATKLGSRRYVDGIVNRIYKKV
jgi:D-alanyl-D-alanine carboxypeptidase